MTQPPVLETRSRIYHPREDIAWLRRLTLAAGLATAFAAAVAMALALVTGDEVLVGLAWSCSCSRAGCCWSVSSGPGAARRASSGARPSGCSSSCWLLLPLVPALAPTLAIAPAHPDRHRRPVPGSAAAPTVRAGRVGVQRRLRTGGLAVLAASARGSGATDVDLLVLEVVGTAIIVGLVVVLILRYARADEDVRFLALHDALRGSTTAPSSSIDWSTPWRGRSATVR